MLLENSSTLVTTKAATCGISSTRQGRRRIHPKNALIVNFSEGADVSEEDVRREFAPFGTLRGVVMCAVDGCQAFVTLRGDPEAGISSLDSVSRLLEITNGIMFVKGSIWTICRPKEWEELMKGTEKKVERLARKEVGVGDMVTVEQLTDIFHDFLRHNSSVSQSSISSNPSSYSVVSTSSSSSSPRSCDSSATITPFSVYPAQTSTGFIPLPPPYHILPDTAFFRRTKIIPPPPSRPEPLSVSQKVMNLYIGSMRNEESQMLWNTRRQSSLELECRWWNPI